MVMLVRQHIFVIFVNPRHSDVLGWASSPEPTRLSPFKPKPWAQAQASSYIHSKFSYILEGLFPGWLQKKFFAQNCLKRLQAR